MPPLRLAALVSHPIQYQAPLFRHLAQSGAVDLEVLFLSDHGVRPSRDPGFGQTVQFDVPLLDGYPHRFLRNLARKPDVNAFAGAVHPELATLLAREKYDALWVHGWAQASCWIAFGAALATRTPLLIRAETTLLLGKRALPLRTARRLALRGLVKASAGLLYVGEENRRFWESMGARADQLYFAPYSVDNAFFAARAQRSSALRETVGASDDDCVILFCGKLVARKRPLDLVAAAAKLSRRAVIAFVGDGAQRAEVERAIAERGVRAKVVGFANQSELPGWYASADLLCLPSDYETWGLVVNEAMACGLPCVVSDLVGSGHDLVANHGTGALFRCGDVEALARALAPFVDDPALRRRAGEAARARVARYDVSETAAGVVAAVQAVGRRR